jgi:prolyl-tRNA synthetase
MSVAPWQVHLCAVRVDDHKIKELADNIYNQLVKKGLEVIYDDRSVSAGVMFSDADLLGVPLRVIISPRNLKENCCEIVSRDKKISLKVKLDECIDQINDLVFTEFAE